MMNRLLLTGTLWGCGLGCALAGSGATGVPGVLGDWLAARKHAADVRVEFRTTKSMPALKEPLKADGRIWSYADGRFRWETGAPATQVLVYDGATLQSWDAAGKQWRKLDPNSRSMGLWMDFLGGRNLTEAGLLKDFEIREAAETKLLTGVILEPKSARVRRDLKQIELRFNAGEQRLVQMLIRQGDGGSQTMDFSAPGRMTAEDRTVVPPPAAN